MDTGVWAAGSGGGPPGRGARGALSGRGGPPPRVARAAATYDGRTVIKRETLPDGRVKLILKDERGDFEDRIVGR